MSWLFWIGLGLAINVGIAAVGMSLKNKRPKMSYTDYLDEYGRSDPYTSDDVPGFMGDDE
jgi:hypothetical protein